MRICRAHIMVSVLFFACRPAAGAVDPGSQAAVEQRRFDKQQEAAEVRERLRKKPEEPVVEVTKPETPAPAAQEAFFRVGKIKISGNRAIPESEIRPLIHPYENRELTLSDVREAAEKITSLYRSRGFITCRAYIPPQRIEEGELEIRILEGTLGEVKTQGIRFFRKENITRFLADLKRKVIEYRELEKRIARMNLHPDREVKAVVLPGQTLGTSDLLLDVQDHFPLHLGAEVNNFGTKLTGKERYGVFGRHTNVFGFDDILAARVQAGDEVFSIGIQYALPVGPFGTLAGVSVNYSEVAVGQPFKDLDLEGEAQRYELFLMQPILDWDFLSVSWTGGFEYKTIDNTALNMPSTRDDLRIFHTGFNVDERDPYGRTFIVNDFAFGVTEFGASDKNDPRLSRSGGGANFFKYSGALNRVHPVYDGTILYLKGSAQFTPDYLVAAEQFDIGGVYSVRGYPQSDYLGDYGGGGSAEIRVPLYFVPRDITIPVARVPVWNSVKLVAFFDGAYAKTRNPDPGIDPSRTFFGVGGGVRIDLPNNFTARFEWATPTGDRPSDRSGSQFYFSISGEFF